MKRILSYGLALVFVLAIMPHCKKKGGGGGCNETTLAVTTTPANGTVEPPAPGPNFALRVSITSTMPPSGVTIEVKARPESSSTTFFTETRNTTTKDNDFSITGTPATTASIVEITVTSKSCTTNKWTGSYRYSMK